MYLFFIYFLFFREKAMEDLSIEDIREAWTLQTETQKEKSNVRIKK